MFLLDERLKTSKNYQATVTNVNGASFHSPAGFSLTDTGNAERLVARYGRDLHYCFLWRKWLIWQGQRWEQDDTGEVIRMAKATARAIATEVAETLSDNLFKECVSWAKQSLNESRISKMVVLAQSEQPIPVLPDFFDKNPWLFNVENGTLDLRTQTLRAHARQDALTKLSRVRHDATEQYPNWEKFLRRIFDDNVKLIRYVQKAVGYSLTGDTREQCLFLLHGTGENGKSTFLSVLSALLGDYAQAADFSTFLHRERDAPRNDIARLRGARVVISSEADEGKRLSESIIKQLTGGDVITARFLFSEHFDFVPQFKLWLAANHKPTIKGTDHAIWRRIRLIPFTVKITKEEKDPNLAALCCSSSRVSICK